MSSKLLERWFLWSSKTKYVLSSYPGPVKYIKQILFFMSGSLISFYIISTEPVEKTKSVPDAKVVFNFSLLIPTQAPFTNA